MSKDFTLKKVLIIGSGPIVIGQAAEFDYAGTQACKAIAEEEIETILINSNPATIMTDQGIADKVYLEPITEDAVEHILAQERPEGVLAGFGGQTGLNLAMALDEKGILEKYGARLLGVNKESIRKAEYVCSQYSRNGHQEGELNRKVPAQPGGNAGSNGCSGA